LEGCSTAIRRVARKVAVVEGRLVGLWKMISLQGCSFWMGGLAYNNLA